MPFAPALRPRLLERAKALKLMGFSKDEVRPVLEAQFGVDILNTEHDELWRELQTELANLPDLTGVKQELGQTWERSKLIQNDLLAVYQLLVRNFNAYMDGETEITDPTTGAVRPVIAVRPNDLIGVADKILKIDQERVTSMMNSLKVMPTLEPTEEPEPVGALPGSSTLALLIDSGDDEDDWDDDEEGIEDAHYESSQ